MTEELVKLPTDELLKKFGAGSHNPGSGSAAALLGLIACKLIQTVVSLSAERDTYQDVKTQLTLTTQGILDGIEPKLLTALQEDSEQFDRVIQARRLRNAEQEVSKKRKLSNDARDELRKATEIPMEIAQTCLDLAEKAIVVFDLGFQAARGDSGVAISSALAGASGAVSIIYLNLTSFKGGEWAKQTRITVDNLLKNIQSLQIQFFERINRLQKEVLTREHPGQ